MDKEKDLKRIVAVVLILIVALVVFICIRSCTKKENDPTPVATPTPTPTATATPDVTPTPTPTPDHQDGSSSSNHTTNSGGQNMSNGETEEVTLTPVPTPVPTPEPTPTPEVITLEQLKQSVTQAREILKTSEGSKNFEFIALVSELETLTREAEVLIEQNMTDSNAIALAKKAIDSKMMEVNQKLNEMISVAYESVETAEGRITTENVAMAYESIKMLPDGELKTALLERLNALHPEMIAYVSTEEELRNAIMNQKIETIVLDNDIKDIQDSISIDRPLTMEANGSSLQFTVDSIVGVLISSDDVTINNLTVTMTNQTKWEKRYALEVTNAKNVTLYNYTGSYADAGLLVNGSEVTLTGVTTVSDNEFGGIEVSREEGLENAILNIEGTLVNETESYGLPTVWLVKDQGVVNGTFAASNSEIIPNVIQYYLDRENAYTEVELAKEELKGTMKLASETLENSSNSTDSEFNALLMKLETLNEDALLVMNDKDATLEQVNEINRNISDLLTQIDEMLEKMILTAQQELLKTEENPTEETIEVAREAILKLPDGSEKTALLNRLEQLKPEMIVSEVVEEKVLVEE